ncbi:Rz1-like lysis system protein LysC [Chitinimonas prasina]|uniref:Rz1-like lysis system protein LysC n=1 Tax=Chitinimonas prasina TaxID=1434937 RepID=UPI0034D587A7
MSGCASAPPSIPPPLIVNGCPTPTRCLLPPASPQTNRDLKRDLDAAEVAWAVCAAKVDMVIACQHKMPHVQTPVTP